MQWELIVALAIAIPIILFPVTLVWYLNSASIYAAIEGKAQERRTAREKGRRAAEAEEQVTVTAAKGQPAEKELIGTTIVRNTCQKHVEKY